MRCLIVTRLYYITLHYDLLFYAAADPGFQVREGALKKIAPSGGRREKSRFYATKSIFFQRATTPPLWISYLTQCSTMQKCIVIVHRVKHANDELISQRNH